MFERNVYVNRRNQLKKLVRSGILFFLGNEECAMNYAGNTFKFRQDSNFLYYFGLDAPSLAALIDVESGEEIIFGDDFDLDDIVWMGPQKSMKELAERVGVKRTEPVANLKALMNQSVSDGRKIHILPPYTGNHLLLLAQLLVCRPQDVKQFVSEEFIRAVVKQREIKSDLEISEIEKAHAVTYDMQVTAMKMAKSGLVEAEISGRLEGIAAAGGSGVSFPIILSVHGEILHNHHHDNTMKNGDLLVVDCGAESNLHYAADITRTIPVSGKYDSRQQDVYHIVLEANERAIAAIKPGIPFKDIHLLAAGVVADGLKQLGLLQGDREDIVRNGAHALFFPHGLGHQMGLDVHDMEGLGEDLVGYDATVSRSDQFGLAYLRMAKKLQKGMVMTVEPGIYFIPELFERWRQERKFTDFINYDAVEKYLNFGGIRIEDDVLVTADGYRVLGETIPKSIKDVETTCKAG